MNQTEQNLINLGRISKPHGLGGYFFFKVPSSLKPKDFLYVGKTPQKLKKAQVEDIKLHQKRTLLKLSIAHDRTSLEPYLGSHLWLESQEKPEDDGLSSYKGQKVFDQEGEELGTCADFYDVGAGPIICIVNDAGKTLELPFQETYFEKSDKLKAKFSKAFFDELWQEL